ncbi:MULTISPECIES: Crp/Fnr family transcriptional regulator [unclassified Ensifer]|uniref:Crp/Fnr family transcriptional regulator n=1 Tax=unclassified Ensifer TaxID=2633371 RepID=UPI00137A0F99|nr:MULTISPECIES: Crp/Fnr family transcriptional regulator [unclassified Ensifer]
MRTVSAMDTRRALLARHPVLGLLEAEDLDHMVGFAVETQYPAGAAIFRKGDPGRSLMIIVEGQVKISVMASDGREAVLAVLEAGDILGEMAIIENKPRSADAITLSPCRVLVLHQRDFIPFLERNPRAAIRLLALLSERLRRTSALLEARMLRHLPERLVKALLDLCESAGSGCRPGDCLELPLRQKVFASLLGTSRETLNKQLHAWQDDGLIHIRGGSIVIEQPERLAKLAGR